MSSCRDKEETKACRIRLRGELSSCIILLVVSIGAPRPPPTNAPPRITHGRADWSLAAVLFRPFGGTEESAVCRLSLVSLALLVST